MGETNERYGPIKRFSLRRKTGNILVVCDIFPSLIPTPSNLKVKKCYHIFFVITFQPKLENAICFGHAVCPYLILEEGGEGWGEG